MPSLAYHLRDWIPQGALAADPATTPGVVCAEGAWLRRLGHDQVSWDPDGDVVDEAVFTTPTYRMDALIEVIGVSMFVVDRPTGTPLEGYAKIQITLDGGNTYFAWTGALWEVQAENGTYTALRDFDENSATLALPTSGAEVGFRIKLESLEKDPVLQGFEPYFEWQHSELLDVYTTVRRAMDAVRYKVLRKTKLAAAADRITPDIRYTADQTAAVVVYNLTADPSRTTDLFDLWDNGVIVLTAQQALGAVLEYEFLGTARITITQRDELVDISEIPHTVVQLGDPADVPRRWSGEIADYKDGTTTRWCRRRFIGPLRQYELELSHWASKPRDAIQAASQLREAVESLRSQETGAAWRIDLDAPERLREARSDGLFGGEFTGRLLVRSYLTNYVQEVLVDTVNVKQVNRPSEGIEVAR